MHVCVLRIQMVKRNCHKITDRQLPKVGALKIIKLLIKLCLITSVDRPSILSPTDAAYIITGPNYYYYYYFIYFIFIYLFIFLLAQFL